MAEHTRSIGFVAALVIAAGVAVGGFAVGRGLERFRTADRTISVKGLAEMDVEGEFAVWPWGFRRAGNDFGAAPAEDRDSVVAFLKGQDFQDAEIEVRPLQVQDLFAREYTDPRQPLRYRGAGQVLVRSARPESAQAASLA